MGTFLSYFMLMLLSFLSFLLIVIVLLQRGRGGGLAGALGGAGGQSAFGTKAGDVFTKITVGLALVWVLVAGLSINVLSWSQGTYAGGSDATRTNLETPDGDTSDAADDAPAGLTPGLTVPEMPVLDGGATPPATESTPAVAPESAPAAPATEAPATPAEAKPAEPAAATPAPAAETPATAAPEAGN